MWGLLSSRGVRYYEHHSLPVGLEGKLFWEVQYTDWTGEISPILCAHESVCACMCVRLDFVWAFLGAARSLSWRAIGSINELLLGQRVRVHVAFVCTFLPGKWRFEVRRVLIWESHQLVCEGVSTTWPDSQQFFGYITGNAIDLQISRSVHLHTPLQAEVLWFVFCIWVRGRASIHFLRGCSQNTGVFSQAVCCANMPLCLKVSK